MLTTTSATTMAIKKCKKCDHKQNLKHTNRVRWACSDCGFRNKMRVILASILILAVSSMSYAYAEEQDLPVDLPYDDKYCTFYALSNYVNFTCTWKWFLPDYVMDELVPLDIPLKTSDIPQHKIELSDKIRLLLESPPVEPVLPPTEREVPDYVTEKREEMEREKEAIPTQ